MVRHILVISVTVSLLVGCTPSQQVTPTARPLTVANSGLVYTPLTAKRIADTRPGSGYQWAGHTFVPGAAMILKVTGSGMAPVNAGAVVLTITTMSGTASGSLTAYPAGMTPPNTSTLSWGPGGTVSNLATVKVGSGGQVSIANMAGTVDVVVDLRGYYARPTGSTGAGRYFPVPLFRLLDTRLSNPIGPGPSAPIRVAGTAVPVAAQAAVLSVTALNTTARSSLAVVGGTLQCPAAGPCPDTWSLHWEPGANVTSRVITPLGKGPDGTAGWISFFNLAGTADLLVDVEGWYADSTIPAAMGSTFTAIEPCRVVDYRNFSDPTSEPRVELFHACGIPTGSTAVVINATTTGAPIVLAPLSPACAAGNLQYVDFGWLSGREVANLDQAALTDGAVVITPIGSSSMSAVNSAGRGVLTVSLDVSGYFTAGPVRSPLICLSDESRSSGQPDLVTATAYDTLTGQPVRDDPIAFTVAPTSGGAACMQSSLRTSSLLTDALGAASVGYDPPARSECLITARDSREAAATITRPMGLLELAPPTGSSPIVVTATYFRSDGSPHPGAVLNFRAIVNSLGGAPVAQGQCVTDSSGQCMFSYRLGIRPAGYHGSTLVFVQDATGIEVSEVVPGS